MAYEYKLNIRLPDHHMTTSKCLLTKHLIINSRKEHNYKILVKMLRKIYKNYRGTSKAPEHHHKNFRAIAHTKLKIYIYHVARCLFHKLENMTYMVPNNRLQIIYILGIP